MIFNAVKPRGSNQLPGSTEHKEAPQNKNMETDQTLSQALLGKQKGLLTFCLPISLVNVGKRWLPHFDLSTAILSLPRFLREPN